MNKDKYAGKILLCRFRNIMKILFYLLEQSSEDQKQHSETFDSRIPRRVVSEGRPYRKHNGLVHAEVIIILTGLKLSLFNNFAELHVSAITQRE